VQRASYLGSLVPTIHASTKHFYKYSYAKGELLSSVLTPAILEDFLGWSSRYLWKEQQEVSEKRFKEICYDFYYTKTIQRTQEFLRSRHIKDSDSIINGIHVPSLKKMLKQVDFRWLSDAQQVSFHGDFIPDNIIKKKTGYTLLDWRQNFGGLLKGGDMYYDIAKLNHNLVINHDIINNNLFSIHQSGNVITCDILRSQRLLECQETLKQYIIEHGLDERKVQILTPILWLNMSPLHSHPYDLFLFYFGKLQLWKALNEYAG
jgi:thiamine kinase-like enzyme